MEDYYLIKPNYTRHHLMVNQKDVESICKTLIENDSWEALEVDVYDGELSKQGKKQLNFTIHDDIWDCVKVDLKGLEIIEYYPKRGLWDIL